MMLTSWDPLKNLQDFERATGARSCDRNWSPATNISREDGAYVLHFDVPGVSKDAIDIDVDRGVLVVSGERKSVKTDSDNKRYYKVESYSGSFRRSFRLPEDADVTSITATQKDGVLTVRVPQTESSQARKVEIAAS
jgi:HSP20 family protein